MAEDDNCPVQLPNPPSLIENGEMRFLIFDAPSDDNLEIYAKVTITYPFLTFEISSLETFLFVAIGVVVIVVCLFVFLFFVGVQSLLRQSSCSSL